jgi:two-component system, sensor histidine kinase
MRELPIRLSQMAALIPGAKMTSGIDSITNREGLIRCEQVRAIDKSMPLTTVVMILTATFLVWVMWDHTSHGLLLLWLGIAVAIHVLRLSMSLRFRGEGLSAPRAAIWQRRFVLGALATGMTWGFAAMVFYVPDRASLQSLLTMIVLGLAAGSVTASAHLLTVNYAFVLPTVVALIARVLMDRGFQHIGIAALLTIFLGFVLYLSRYINRVIAESFRMRFERIELIDELSAQKEELEKAWKEAQAASIAKTRFLSSASHDLRQPMHTVGLLVGLLRDRGLPPDDKRVIDKIYASIQAMEKLFKGLLDISRLDAGIVQPTLAAFPVSNMFESSHATFAAQAEEKQLAVRFGGSRVWVKSDPVILERILSNLVSNAIRYTSRGHVLVGCRRRGELIEIQVLDTGSGIPKKHQEDIFQEFFQLDNPERDRAKGLGLGLSIVRRSAELLGHRVTVRSEPGKGSCFSVFVPRVSGAPASPSTDDSLVQTGTVLTGTFVLLIDDEQDVRFAMESTFAHWGCPAVCAASAQDAIDQLKGHLRNPDVIISDFRLREHQTGIGAVQQIRCAVEEDIPAIIITGDISAHDIEMVARSGFSLAHKPVSAEHLRRLIVAALDARKALPAG